MMMMMFSAVASPGEVGRKDMMLNLVLTVATCEAVNVAMTLLSAVFSANQGDAETEGLPKI